MSNVSPKYNLEITPEIIKRAQRANSHACLIAEAMKDVGLQYVMVDLQTCRGTDPRTKQRYVWLTPRRAQLALVDFDQGVPTEPFRVRLSNAQVVSIRKTKEKKRSQQETAEIKLGRGARTGGGASPSIRGGRLPPTAGLRRSYGIRALRDPFEGRE